MPLEASRGTLRKGEGKSIISYWRVAVPSPKLVINQLPWTYKKLPRKGEPYRVSVQMRNN